MKIKSSLFLLFLAGLFFLSGACGLVYEIIWVRKLGLIFGNTTLAISTVLAVFMAGLGLGSLFFGKQIDKHGHPFAWYGFLEIGIGFFCFCTPWFWVFIEKFYVWVYQWLPLSFWPFSVFRFLLCFAFLFVPTFLMGGTLPVLTKFLIRDHRLTSRVVGVLYGINTLGAVVGVLGTSFYAIYVFGLQGTVLMTAGINILIGLIVLFVLRLKRFIFTGGNPAQDVVGLQGEDDAIESPVESHVSETNLATILLFAFALSGFTSMAYELCWTKVLALCLGSSVYSFAIMLASFLTGLALGSLLIGWLAKKIRVSFYLFGLLELGIGLFALWGINIFDQMPLYFLQLFAFFGQQSVHLHIAKFVLASLVILPPAMCIGGTFAVVAHILNRLPEKTGQTIGRVYFINTLGCIAGSVLTGFVLIPWVGIYKTLLMMIVVNILLGLMILCVAQKRFSSSEKWTLGFLVILLSVLFLQTHPWSKGLLTSNIAIDPRTYLGHSKFEILNSTQQSELLYYKEGLSATVAVKRHQDVLSLSINANVDASTGTDMYTQLMLGHLPSLLVDHPKRALVIGMGSGVTLGALATYDYHEIHCVELEGAVLKAAQYFLKQNRHVLADPRLTNFVNDGRHHLLTENFSYDVIVSEPSSPWMAGVANLFTREQFELMKKRLSRQGVVCQWLNTYSMSSDNIQMIVKTFREVFPYASLWQTIGADLLLVGSTYPIAYDIDAINKKFAHNALLKEDLKDFTIDDAVGILSCFLLTNDELLAMSLNAPINSDNVPLLEYSAPLNLYGFEQVVSDNMQMITIQRKQRYPAMVRPPQNSKEVIAFHNTLARAFLQKGNYQEAGIEIGLSNQEEAFNPEAILNYGILQTFLGNADEAITNLENYLNIGKENAEAYFYLGKAYEFKQLFDQALKYYQLAVMAEPSHAEYLFVYGESLMGQGEKVEGIRFLQKAIDFEGLDFRSGLILSQAFFFNQQLDPAVRTLELLLNDYPHFYKIYETMASFYEAVGQNSQALAVYHEANKKLPFDARIYYAMATLYQKLGKIKESRMMMRKYFYYNNAPRIGVR